MINCMHKKREREWLHRKLILVDELNGMEGNSTTQMTHRGSVKGLTARA